MGGNQTDWNGLAHKRVLSNIFWYAPLPSSSLLLSFTSPSPLLSSSYLLTLSLMCSNGQNDDVSDSFESWREETRARGQGARDYLGQISKLEQNEYYPRKHTTFSSLSPRWSLHPSSLSPLPIPSLPTRSFFTRLMIWVETLHWTPKT